MMKQKEERRKIVSPANRKKGLHLGRIQEKALKGMRIVAIILCIAAVGAVGFRVVQKNEKTLFSPKNKQKTEESVDAKKGQEETKTFQALNDVKDAKAQITSYDSYGTSLNLEGDITLPGADKITGLSLAIRNAYEDPEKQKEPEYTQKLKYEVDGTEVTFRLSDKITNGFCLEELKTGDYCALLQVEYGENGTEYHSFTNTSGEKDLEYYTLTRNQSNNKINLSFLKEQTMTYLSLKSVPSELPDDVYDIVIDAGHGGNDSGAVNGSYTEADIVLDIALALRDSLEKEGFKVFLTRDGSEDPNEKTVYTMYDKNGRVNVTGRSKAKYSLSLHLNSNVDRVNITGVQVYASIRGDNRLAKCFADNIVNIAQTTYSGMKTYCIEDGVYNRAYTEADIADAASKAQSAGYEPYNITTDTDYFYMVRETGGMATNAYVDGRNTSYGKNEFMDSNQGIQSFLLELGYISEDVDLQNLLTNQGKYVQAITDTLVEENAKYPNLNQ